MRTKYLITNLIRSYTEGVFKVISISRVKELSLVDDTTWSFAYRHLFVRY